MQRVVRSSLIGLLAIAGLTACGDKVEVQGPTTTPVSNVVREVTVSPSSATLNSGDKITLAASVNADAGVTDRTVTWSSSNTAIASVDANGLVTAGTTAGTATITATSKADPTVKGAALITVNSPNTGAAASVTISTINQTVCVVGGGCSSVPANLGNVTGQIDVTLNVDPGAQKLAGVDLIMNCSGNGNSGQDTVIATQNLSATNVAVEAASAPVTLSFNTATFNSTTGAVAFRNGSCILKARARTTGGTTVASGSQTLTLNNTDVVIGSVTSTKTAINPNGGLLWNGGDVTATATPVLFSGRTPATMSLILEGKAITKSGTGTQTATWTDGNGANAGGATDIDGITDPAAAVTFTLVDTNGQPVLNPAGCGAGASLCSSASYLANPNAPAAIATIRLDTQKPAAGTFPIANNADQGTGATTWVGSNFRFAADSAAGYRGPNAVAGNQTRNLDNVVTAGNPTGAAGVDNITVTFQWRVTGASSSTYAALTNTSALNETTTSTGDQLRMITADALGNADTTTVTTFGVDKTAPSNKLIAPADQSTSTTIGGVGAIQDSIGDNLSGRGNSLVAQTRLSSSVSTSTTLPAEGTIFTNGSESVTGPCVIGRFNTTSALAGANALPAFERGGSQVGFCTPVPYTMGSIGSNSTVPSNASLAANGGYFTTRIISVDIAGNQAAPVTVTIAEDGTNPTVNNIDLPGSVSGNSTASFPASATEDVDLTGSIGAIKYTTPANNGGTPIVLQYPTNSGPGVAFDNALTRSGTVTASIPNFIINLQVNSGGAIATPGTTVGTGNADSVTVIALNEVGRRGQLTAKLSPSVQLSGGASSSFNTTTFTGGFGVAAGATTLSNCPAAGCSTAAAPTTFVAPTNATSTTLTASASGTASTFSNPFSGGAVTFWYSTDNTTWFLAATAGSGSSVDTGNGTPGVGARTWSYSATFDPPSATPNGVSLTPAPGGSVSFAVRAIGVNTNGDGVASQPITITVTNP